MPGKFERALDGEVCIAPLSAPLSCLSPDLVRLKVQVRHQGSMSSCTKRDRKTIALMLV